jgi:hypothetical protein
MIVGNEDCANRVRNACYQQFSQDAAKQSGCTQAGLARCGVAGLGAFDLTPKKLIVGALLVCAIGAVLFGRK